MKKDIFNKATKLSRNIEVINKVIDSSNDLKHPCYRSLFSSSLLTLIPQHYSLTLFISA